MRKHALRSRRKTRGQERGVFFGARSFLVTAIRVAGKVGAFDAHEVVDETLIALLTVVVQIQRCIRDDKRLTFRSFKRLVCGAHRILRSRHVALHVVLTEGDSFAKIIGNLDLRCLHRGHTSTVGRLTTRIVA